MTPSSHSAPAIQAVGKILLLWAFALVFMVGGTLHFVSTPGYVRLMPPMVPYPLQIVYISGVIEAGLGLLLLFPPTRRAAAWGLIVTLIAIFPANVWGAISAGTDHEAMPGVSVELAWLRLPLQFLLIYWAYRYTKE